MFVPPSRGHVCEALPRAPGYLRLKETCAALLGLVSGQWPHYKAGMFGHLIIIRIISPAL